MVTHMVNLNSSLHSDISEYRYPYTWSSTSEDSSGPVNPQQQAGSQHANPSPYGVASSQSYDPNVSGYDKPSGDPVGPAQMGHYVSGHYDSPVVSHSAAAGSFNTQQLYKADPANSWYGQNVHSLPTDQLGELMVGSENPYLNTWISPPKFSDFSAWEAVDPQSHNKPYPKIPPTYIVQSRNGYQRARAFRSHTKYSPEYSEELLQVDPHHHFSPQMGSKGQA